jgi:hypothetical protein
MMARLKLMASHHVQTGTYISSDCCPTFTSTILQLARIIDHPHLTYPNKENVSMILTLVLVRSSFVTSAAQFYCPTFETSRLQDHLNLGYTPRLPSLQYQGTETCSFVLAPT